MFVRLSKSFFRAVGILPAMTLILLVRFYQKVVSPFLPPSCIYAPSCSEYAILSLQKHGPVLGLYLATKRFLSCHPFRQGGFDPVPERFTLFKRRYEG